MEDAQNIADALLQLLVERLLLRDITRIGDDSIPRRIHLKPQPRVQWSGVVGLKGSRGEIANAYFCTAFSEKCQLFCRTCQADQRSNLFFFSR